MVSLVSGLRINWRRHGLWWLTMFQLAEAIEPLRGGFWGKLLVCWKKATIIPKNIQAVDVTFSRKLYLKMDHNHSHISAPEYYFRAGSATVQICSYSIFVFKCTFTLKIITLYKAHSSLCKPLKKEGLMNRLDKNLNNCNNYCQSCLQHYSFHD